VFCPWKNLVCGQQKRTAERCGLSATVNRANPNSGAVMQNPTIELLVMASNVDVDKTEIGINCSKQDHRTIYS